MEKVKERTSKYGISVRNTSNGYFEARTTFRLGGGHSNRLQKGGKTQELAVLNLLIALDNFIDNSLKNGTLISKIDDAVSQQLVKSINDLGIVMPEIMQKALEIVNRINGINASISNNLYIQSNVIPFYNQQNNNANINIPQSTTASSTEKKQVIMEKYIIEDVAIQWKKYELQLCIKSDDNPRPLSHKTVDGYIKILDNKILPYFKVNNLLYINQVTENIIKDLIKCVNGYHGKRNVYIVCVLMFRYLVHQSILSNDPMANINKPIKPNKTKEDDIVCIEPENYYLYINAFEKENTDVSLLFETILYAGLRPEEACGLKWDSFCLDKQNNRYEFIVQNASKNIAVYDDNMNKIGYKKQDDTLKTDESYRCVPVNPRLAKQLLKHKEIQKQRIKNSIKMKKKGKKWNENEYIFLSRYYQPYVPESLPKPLRQICDKHKLERFSPYALRRSFATWCFENGMSETTLTEIMGHSNFRNYT